MVIVAALLLSLAVQDQTAESHTGMDLLQLCESFPKLKAYGGDVTLEAGEVMPRSEMQRRLAIGLAAQSCTRYIDGVFDALMVSEIRRPASGLACAPDKMFYRQSHLIVLKFLRDHPERLHEHQGVLAVDALAQAFPCKATKK